MLNIYTYQINETSSIYEMYIHIGLGLDIYI